MVIAVVVRFTEHDQRGVRERALERGRRDEAALRRGVDAAHQGVCVAEWLTEAGGRPQLHFRSAADGGATQTRSPIKRERSWHTHGAYAGTSAGPAQTFSVIARPALRDHTASLRRGRA
jgi:hypothetical protein